VAGAPIHGALLTLGDPSRTLARTLHQCWIPPGQSFVHPFLPLAVWPMYVSEPPNPRGWVIRDTVYTHCWDPTGTRLFMGGGPLAVGLSGCSLSVWM
jgi:hypothetical protein